jgi:DNA-binding CsgD family transcriptional regulator
MSWDWVNMLLEWLMRRLGTTTSVVAVAEAEVVVVGAL